MEYQSGVLDVEMDVQDVDFEVLDAEIMEIKQKLIQLKGMQPIATKSSNLEQTSWSIVQDWIQCPIGVLPGGNEVSDLSLDLSYDNMTWLHENGMLYIPISSDAVFETKEPENLENDEMISIF
jgi:hypothetical protein